jgi:hypothetical protein
MDITARRTVGAPSRYVRAGVRQYDDIEKKPVIVAHAAIHLGRMTLASMDTEVRQYDEIDIR